MSADKVIVFNEGTGTNDSQVKITTMEEIVKSGSEILKALPMLIMSTSPARAEDSSSEQVPSRDP